MRNTLEPANSDRRFGADGYRAADIWPSARPENGFAPAPSRDGGSRGVAAADTTEASREAPSISFADPMPRVPRVRVLPPGVRMHTDSTVVVAGQDRLARYGMDAPGAAPSWPEGAPFPADRAEAATYELAFPRPPAARARRMDQLRNAVSNLGRASGRPTQETKRLVAWLLDQGVVVLDQKECCLITRKPQKGSDRLVKLGLMRSFPSFSAAQTEALGIVLSNAWAAQSSNKPAPLSIDQLTQELGEALLAVG